MIAGGTDSIEAFAQRLPQLKFLLLFAGLIACSFCSAVAAAPVIIHSTSDGSVYQDGTPITTSYVSVL